MDQRYANGPWYDPEELDLVKLPDKLSLFKADLIAEYITPHKFNWLPGYILKELSDAAQSPESEWPERMHRIRDKMSLTYLADVARGRIKSESSTPMPEDVKIKLRELNKARKLEKKTVNIKVTEQPKKLNKLHVYEDKDAQNEVLKKYPLVVAGSFKHHPDKIHSTLVDIKCEKCSERRTINLCDCFHVKRCIKCKL